jgi:predicted membrane protein
MLPSASVRFGGVALVAAGLVAVAIAVPTATIDNPWFSRMTPVHANQYVYWIGTSLLTGVLLATYVGGRGYDRGASTAAAGTVLGYLAVGCPICNKLVVALLGAGGAMEFFAPVQPFLGALGMALAALALYLRIRTVRRGSCPVPAAAA